MTDLADVRAAFERGEHDHVLRLTDAGLARRPGDDALHEYRARAFLALGRAEEARRHAADAVRLDPDETRYRELLAQTLSAAGAHRDAAAEYGRLARNDPGQAAWTVAEAEERLGAAQAGMGVEAARRAVRLAPTNGRAQLALAQALARTGDARGALAAAHAAERLLPGDAAAAEAHADARWLANDRAGAFARYRDLAAAAPAADRARLERKARTLYRQEASPGRRVVAGIGPLFELAFRRGWLKIGR